jgi:MFS family permease
MLPLYLQNLRGLSALDTGLLLMPQGLAVGLAGPLAGRLVDKIGARPVVVAGCLLLALNTWDLAQITLATSYGELRGLLVLRGLALGLAATPTQLVGLGAVPEHLRTNASSLFTALKSVFSAFGVALLATDVQTQTSVRAAGLGGQVRVGTAPGAAVAQIGGLLRAHGAAASAAHLAAVRLMAAEVGRQGAVLAFGDAYRLTFVAALLALLLALLLPGRGVKVDRAAMAAG